MRTLYNIMKRLISVLLIGSTLVLAGCGIITLNEEKDRNLVVAEVNGEKILKAAVLDEYKLYTAMYGEDRDYAKEIKKQILEQLVNRAVIMQKAKAAGFELNDEYRKKAEEELEDYLKEDAERRKEEDIEKAKPSPSPSASPAPTGTPGETADPTASPSPSPAPTETPAATAEPTGTPTGSPEPTGTPRVKTDEEYLEDARKAFEDWLKRVGLTKEEYLERIAEDLVVKAYFDELTKDLKVEDKEIKEYYDEQVEFQTKYPSYRAYSSVLIVKEPAMRRVKHILIKLPDEVTDKIADLRNGKKNDEADKLRAEKLKDIKTKADEVLAKVKAGDSFDILVDKHGEDPGMKDSRYKDGYTMYRDSSFVQEFLDASFKLKKDETSDLVASDYGYHIIKVYEAKEDEIEKYEDVKDEIHDALLESKKNKKSNELLDEWVKASNIKKYESRL